MENKEQAVARFTVLNTIKAIAINVNSIISNQRRATLLNLLKDEKPEFVLLGETKLSERYNISFKEYMVVRSDRRNAVRGGGTAILVKDTIKHERVYLNCLVNSVCLEATVLKINLAGGSTLFIIAAYAAGNNKREFIPELEALFVELNLKSLANYYILAGDLNAKHTDWQNSTNNSRGISLKKWVESKELELRINLFGSELPSYPRGNSFLDLGLIDNRLMMTNLSKTNRLETINYDSDHNAIKMSISYEAHLALESAPETHRYNFNKIDWEKLKKYIAKNATNTIPANKNLSNKEIDDAIDHLDEVIITAIKKSVPKIKKFNSAEAYISPRISELQKHKSFLISNINRLYRAGTTINLVRLNILKGLLKETKNKIKEAFAKNISIFWENKIKNISISDPKKMIPQVNGVFRPRGKSTIPVLKIPPEKSELIDNAEVEKNSLLLDQNHSYIILDPLHKLNVIGAHFAAANMQNLKLGKHRLSEIVEKRNHNLRNEIELEAINEVTVTNFEEGNFAFEPKAPDTQNYFTTMGKTRLIFRNLNNKRSTSWDGIPNIILKHLPLTIIVRYAIIFNNALNNKYFPKKWKTAKVIALRKKGKDGSDPSSYRTITISLA